MSNNNPNPPILSNSDERQQSIINNTAAIFNIENNPNADSKYGEWRAVQSIGINTVNRYNSIIEQKALEKGVDANLVKAIIYMENGQDISDVL